MNNLSTQISVPCSIRRPPRPGQAQSQTQVAAPERSTTTCERHTIHCEMQNSLIQVLASLLPQLREPRSAYRSAPALPELQHPDRPRDPGPFPHGRASSRHQAEPRNHPGLHLGAVAEASLEGQAHPSRLAGATPGRQVHPRALDSEAAGLRHRAPDRNPVPNRHSSGQAASSCFCVRNPVRLGPTLHPGTRDLVQLPCPSEVLGRHRGHIRVLPQGLPSRRAGMAPHSVDKIHSFRRQQEDYLSRRQRPSLGLRVPPVGPVLRPKDHDPPTAPGLAGLPALQPAAQDRARRLDGSRPRPTRPAPRRPRPARPIQLPPLFSIRLSFLVPFVLCVAIVCVFASLRGISDGIVARIGVRLQAKCGASSELLQNRRGSHKRGDLVERLLANIGDLCPLCGVANRQD